MSLLAPVPGSCFGSVQRDGVAEGVESSTQSRILLQRGCTTAQGYFFSPPLFPNDVKRMLQSPMRGRARRPAPGRLGAQRN